MSTPRPDDHRGWIERTVAQYEGPLVRYAQQQVRDLATARDVVQDVFLRLCRQDRARVDDHLAEWLFTVCRNRIIDLRRKEQRMTSIDDPRDVTAEPSTSDPSAEAQHNDTLAAVGRQIEQLPVNQREVVRLKFQEGLSYREISRITELSVSNVGYLLHQAVAKLRGRLA